jgi:acetyl-CoA synthetase
MEIESALVSHPSVAEAAVVPRPDDVKGQAIVGFVTTDDHVDGGGPELAEELRAHVGQEIGAIAKPAEVRFAPDLPKTRSGKIMRRLLGDIAAGREPGDVTTLEDPDVLDALIKD